MAVKPLSDRVLVKPVEREEMTKGGIYLPETVKDKPQEGKVIAVGVGKRNEKGEIVPMEVKVGDTVIYAKYGGTEIKEDGETLNIFMAREDLANLSNMTTSNAIRTLSSFVQEKIIIVDGRRIKIVNEQALRNISKFG